MAINGAYVSYTVVGNREDLIELITLVSRKEAPVSSRLSSGPAATNKTHEYQTDTLATPTVSAAVEGDDFSAATLTPTTRLSNWLQIIRKDIKVSRSQVDAFKHAGAPNEYAYQKGKALQEIARHEEFSLLHASGNSGASGTARVMKGIMQSITTNVDTGTSTANNTVLTEGRYNTQLQAVYQSGGLVDLVVADPFNKRQISQFAGGPGSTRRIEAETKKLVNAVDAYASDFGEQTIIPHYMLGANAGATAQTTTGTVLLLQTDRWKKAVARPIGEIPMAPVGDSYVGTLLEELTLEALAEQHSAKMSGYTTA